MGNNSEQTRHILVIEDRKARRLVTLENSTYSIGRDTKNNIVLYEHQVSRHHATLLRIVDYKTDQFFYRIIDGDLQGKRSTNGLMINSRKSLSHELQHGDIIGFGGKAKAIYKIILDSSPDFNLIENDEVASEEKTSIEQKKNKAKNEDISKETLAFPEESELEESSQKDLIRLASFPELSPNPIIEINNKGEVTYANSAAILRFKDIENTEKKHPIIAGLIEENNIENKPQGLLVREVKIGSEIFEQYVHYLADIQVVRSYIFDYTKRKHNNIAIKASEAIYHSILNKLDEGILLVNAVSKKIIQANYAYSNLTGYSIRSLVNLSLSDVVDLEKDVIENKITTNIRVNNQLVGKSVHRHKNGYLIDVNVKVNTVNYEDQQAICLIVREKKEQATLSQDFNQNILLYDPLTGLPNKTLFLEHLTKAIANAQRHQNLVGILLVEINHREKITTPIARQEQEKIIKTISQVIKNSLRAGDTVSRWDSYQFIILLSRLFEIKDIGKIAQRLLKHLQVLAKEFSINCNFNIGGSVYPTEGEEASVLIDRAQHALEKIKEKPGNNFYNAQVDKKTVKLLKAEKLLETAMEKEELKIYYQPVVRLDDQLITCLEAIIHWQHPEVGIVTADKFMPVAKKTNMINKIGDWLVNTICKQNQAWRASGVPIVPISISFSARQFQESNLIKKLVNVLDKYGLEHRLLEIAIDSECISENQELATKKIQELNKVGISVSLDDFGIGVSYLEYLQQFTFSRLKLHQSLTTSILNPDSNNAIINAAIALSKVSDVKVIAKGVETAEQVDKLRELRCHEIQGNFIYQPLNPEEIVQINSEYFS